MQLARSGDPLSPMLFILVMEVLNKLFQRANDDGLLQPLGCNAIVKVGITYQCRHPKTTAISNQDQQAAVEV